MKNNYILFSGFLLSLMVIHIKGETARERYAQLKEQARIAAQKAAEFAKAHKKELITGAVGIGVGAGLIGTSVAAASLSQNIDQLATKLERIDFPKTSVQTTSGFFKEIDYPTYARIYVLHKSGYPASVIAARVGIKANVIPILVKQVSRELAKATTEERVLHEELQSGGL